MAVKMKTILQHPQAPGSGGSRWIDAQASAQLFMLRREGDLTLNLGDQNQNVLIVVRDQFQRQGARLFDWPDSGFNQPQSTRFNRTNMRLFASECHSSG